MHGAGRRAQGPRGRRGADPRDGQRAVGSSRVRGAKEWRPDLLHHLMLHKKRQRHGPAGGHDHRGAA